MFGKKVMIWRAFLTVIGCWDLQNPVFTNQCGATDERSMSRDELAQSMPCKEEEDEVKLQTILGNVKGWM